MEVLLPATRKLAARHVQRPLLALRPDMAHMNGEGDEASKTAL
jgi:hypothetical protein